MKGIFLSGLKVEDGISFEDENEILLIIGKFSLLMKLRCCLFVGLFTFSIQACSPSLSRPFPIPVLSPIKEMTQDESKIKGSSLYFIRDVLDKRASSALIEFDGESYTTDADVSPLVREGMEIALGNKGYQSSVKSSVHIVMAIIRWQCQIGEGLPAKIESQAELQVQIITLSGVKVYTGKYTGSAEGLVPNVSNESAKESLGLAMSEAIRQVLADEGFHNAVLNVSATNKQKAKVQPKRIEQPHKKK